VRPPLAVTTTSRTWLLVLVTGAALWLASTAALAVTGDEILLPSVVLLGSFLAPVTVIFWFIEHERETALSPRRLLLAFFGAGVLGLIAAAMLEVWLLPSRLLPNVWVGLIEEAVKAIGVIVVAHGLRRHTVTDGVVLGVVVGLGFGAFESSGYALSYGFSNGHFSLSNLISEEILRAVIAPFCHGLWTGLFGAALFAAARDGRLRFTLGVLGAYFAAAVLHMLWDASSTAAIVVTVLAAGDETERDALSSGSLPPPSVLTPQWLYGLVQWVVMIAVAAVGSLLVRRRWRSQPARPSRVRPHHPPGA
jgi:RsiW-degrading membrane proteinase PrsW (M82 family)